MTTQDRYTDGFIAGMKSAQDRMSTGPDGRAFWQEEPCPTWCLGHHTDGEDYADRHHLGHEHSIGLRTEDMDEGPKQLNVALWGHYREREPRVSLNVNGRIGVYLTLVETGQLAAILQRVVGEGSSTEVPGKAALRTVA